MITSTKKAPGIFPVILMFSLLTAHCSLVFSQVPTVQDCMGAIPVCQDVYVEENSYSGDGNYNNEIYEDLPCNTACPGSCLAGEVNSVWYIWTVQVGGLLRLTIDPVQSTDDYDWAVYDVTDLRCDDIYTSYALMQKSCNAYGAGSNGNTGISTQNGGNSNCNNCGATNIWNKDLPVVEGRTYVLIIENWSGTTQGYTLDFSASTAVIYDDVRPELATVLTDEITCGDTQIVVEFSENVMCESVNPSDFKLSGPGGPYTILGVQGEVCLAGGEMEKRYTLLIDRPINSDGDYSVELKPLNFVYDACNNFAIGNTIVFTVELGAPLINEFNLEINAATCGLANGSITGLQIIGTPPYTYLWTDDSGNTVGTTLDLLNVPTGNYTLRVSDNNTCMTLGGPYLVEETGAPLVNDNNILITGANWGANNGHITGLDFSGNEPFVFKWMDDNYDSIGNAPELHDVYSGNYYLLVTDVYACDTLAGPYFVQQIGGPIGVEATASESEICLGEDVQLFATGFGGAGNYTFSWISNPPGFASDIQNPVVFPAVTTTYTVTISDGYNVTSSSVTVTVHPIPLSNAGQDITINFGTSTTLYGQASGSGGPFAFAWQPADMLISPNEQNTATKNLYGTTVFTLKVTDINTGCLSLADTVVVNLSGGPLGVSVTTTDDTICKGESTTITAYGFGGNYGTYTITWFDGAEIVKVDYQSPSTLIVSPDDEGPHIYNVEIDDGFNTSSNFLKITVFPSPVFNILGSPQIISCPTDTVRLSPDQLIPGAEYYWSNGSTDVSLPVVSTGIGFNSRTFDLTVTNLQGCVHKDTVTVVFDFTACTGIDEFGEDPGINLYPNPSEGIINVEFLDASGLNTMQIINPYGVVVLNRPITNPGNDFLKTEINLAGLPSGIYFFKALFNRNLSYHKVIIR